MGAIYTDFVDFMKKPAVIETLIDLLMCSVPIWVAVSIGLVIGWSWRPRWTGLVYLGLRSRFRFMWTVPPGLGARRFWFAFTALSAFSVCGRIWANFRRKGLATMAASIGEEREVEGDLGAMRRSSGEISSNFSYNNGNPEGERDVVTEKDLEHVLHLLDGKVGEIAWQNQMERTTSNMFYQAWRLEPEVGPVIYRSRTVFEDATPELVRDFFWDDEFRCKWDNMLAYYKILEEFPQNGTMIVHWIKKFPFFCSDREYIIGRRIWESGKTYYCVTKPALEEKNPSRIISITSRHPSLLLPAAFLQPATPIHLHSPANPSPVACTRAASFSGPLPAPFFPTDTQPITHTADSDIPFPKPFADSI